MCASCPRQREIHIYCILIINSDGLFPCKATVYFQLCVYVWVGGGGGGGDERKVKKCKIREYIHGSSWRVFLRTMLPPLIAPQPGRLRLGKGLLTYHFTVYTVCQLPVFNYNHSYSDPDAKEGDVIRFGQYITLTTLPNEGGKVGTLP